MIGATVRTRAQRKKTGMEEEIVQLSSWKCEGDRRTNNWESENFQHSEEWLQSKFMEAEALFFVCCQLVNLTIMVSPLRTTTSQLL